MFSCPMEGCKRVYHNIEALREHLKKGHGLTCRETWPFIDRLKVPGEDIEKFKRDYSRLMEGTF
ncbi:MAG: hypothetical protein PHZ19_03680 [Candidatus Thermoplasmatota archaeon]|nr:hypothetical protein [Candidatus Thermoplasmatota archaeon]